MAKVQVKAAPGASSRVNTLKKRAEYLRVRKGARFSTPAFVLEAKGRVDGARAAETSAPQGRPRFGFTITKQVGKAVERNRIRRRLKAAVGGVAADHARGDFDYVLIARRPALTAEFGTLVADLVKALGRVHPARPSSGGAARPIDRKR